MTKRLDPKDHAWMTAEPTRAVMAALMNGGGEARFVGGAVRNALIGAPVTDVDIATPLLPDEVTRRLEAAGLGAVPTGIEHGTVTAIAFGRPFEVTTLRRDVTTDGRRAVVAFTADWNEDAQRRDFTMNALYATTDGTLFDPTGGAADLEKGRVSFIGDANARIREDYLRILRLFRFHAWYGRGALDEAAVSAAAAGKAGLAQLSGERIGAEMLKLLAAPNPLPVLTRMRETGILSMVVPANVDLDRLAGYLRVESLAPFLAWPNHRLTALLSDEVMAVREVADRLRLGNEMRDWLLAPRMTPLSPDVTPQEIARLVYRHGGPAVHDRARLLWAADGGKHSDEYWRRFFDTIDEKQPPPEFPVSGNDVMALGIAEGPRVGQILTELETWWVEQDFKPDRAALLARLKDLAKRSAT